MIDRITEKHLYLGIRNLFTDKLGIGNHRIKKEDKEFEYLGELDSMDYDHFVPAYFNGKGVVLLLPEQDLIVLKGKGEHIAEAKKSIEGGLEIKFFD